MRKFRIINISGGRGRQRVVIPLGPGLVLPPGTPPGRRRKQVKRDRLAPLVSEAQLRRLVGFYRRGQLSVTAIDGQPLPSWLDTPPCIVEDPQASSSPEPVDTASEVASPVVVSEVPSSSEATTPEEVEADPPTSVETTTPEEPEVGSSAEETPELTSLNIQDLQPVVANMNDLAELYSALDAEQNARNRKTALKFFRARIAELEGEEEENDAEE